MPDIRLQTYTSAAANALTTELNSLAAGSYCAASGAIDNSTSLDPYDDLVLTVTFASAPTVNTPIDIYLIPAIDGTNYLDSGTPARNLWVGCFLVQAVTTAQRLGSRGIPLPPGLFKYVLRNGTNQAFPASGSVMPRRPGRQQAG
jgi:hypothetical protein